MNHKSALSCIGATLIAIGAAWLPTTVYSHGGGNWNDFTIDRVNDTVYARILDIQHEVAELIRQRKEAETWPSPKLKRLRDDLMHHKEEVDEILAYFLLDGKNPQAPETTRADPRIGRSVAASGAVSAAIALIDRAAAVENQAALIEDFYAQGRIAWLFELVEAHRDRMDLYGILMGSTAHSAPVEQ